MSQILNCQLVTAAGFRLVGEEKLGARHRRAAIGSQRLTKLCPVQAAAATVYKLAALPLLLLLPFLEQLAAVASCSHLS